MINYEFPKLKHIDDVLPHIEGRDEFIVCQKEFGFPFDESYTVINYVVNKDNTFDMEDENDLSSAIRRECRGLIFDSRGILVSRPFHKFFNLGEREETLLSNVDFNLPYTIMSKMDGSMVRPIFAGGLTPFLATKMGITDIANDAFRMLSRQENFLEKLDWLYDIAHSNKTPLLEYISPDNKIVIPYEEPDLILLGVRDNYTGEYEQHLDSPFKTCYEYPPVKDMGWFVDDMRIRTGIEGVVVRFDSGHMIKVKTDEYVLLHKTKEKIQEERHIAELILLDYLDDVMPLLDQQDSAKVMAYNKAFWGAIGATCARLDNLVHKAKNLYDGDRKRIALELIPQLDNKADAQFIFKGIDGHDMISPVINHVIKNINSRTKYNEVKAWLNLDF